MTRALFLFVICFAAAAFGACIPGNFECVINDDCLGEGMVCQEQLCVPGAHDAAAMADGGPLVDAGAGDAGTPVDGFVSVDAGSSDGRAADVASADGGRERDHGVGVADAVVSDAVAPDMSSFPYEPAYELQTGFTLDSSGPEDLIVSADCVIDMSTLVSSQPCDQGTFQLHEEPEGRVTLHVGDLVVQLGRSLSIDVRLAFVVHGDVDIHGQITLWPQAACATDPGRGSNGMITMNAGLGGGGGSFATAGGAGGAGGGEATGAAGGAAGSVAPSPPQSFRGGCAGGLGGYSEAIDPVCGGVFGLLGSGGCGAGALHIAAAGSVTFGSDSIILAAGAHGQPGSSPATDWVMGGGGGGSGGLVVVEGTSVIVEPGACISARGGFGGQGEVAPDGSGAGSWSPPILCAYPGPGAPIYPDPGAPGHAVGSSPTSTVSELRGGPASESGDVAGGGGAGGMGVIILREHFEDGCVQPPAGHFIGEPAPICDANPDSLLCTPEGC